jgi:hypothetical protein
VVDTGIWQITGTVKIRGSKSSDFTLVNVHDDPVAPTPLPPSLALFISGLGAMCMLLVRARKGKSKAAA